jgi:hypothetical protein
VNPIIINASKLIDEWTSSWFDARSVVVSTEACRDGQRKLFVPAPIISVASLTENGQALPSSSYVVYRKWIEKRWSNPYPVAGYPGAPGLSWSRGQLNIVLTGVLGHPTPPADIVEATAFVAATIMGIRSEIKQSPSGHQSASLLTSLPDYIQATVRRHAMVGLHQQPFLIEAA